MGRGPKFSFPLPGRNKSSTRIDRHDNETTSATSTPSQPEWSPRFEDFSSVPKAQRVLGTIPYRPSSRGQPSMPQSPGHMTITVSEASFGSEYTDKASMPAEDGPLYPPKRPTMSNRPSSNALGSGFQEQGRRGSNSSSVRSPRLHSKTSNSTMRSHYDPHKSPLSISQQTSDSAVRDRALRKGHPEAALTFDDEHVAQGARTQHRKSKPARLDLSKLFPKPKASNGTTSSTGPLLSPNKMVNSPVALSATSEYFPRPMTREPTPSPGPRSQAKLTKSTKQREPPQVQPQQRSTSPQRLHERDAYDSAKINVRRPPRGIQHWFDGLDDSTEEEEPETTPVAAVPMPTNARVSHMPISKNSLGAKMSMPKIPNRQESLQSVPKQKLQYTHPKSYAAHRLNSPSEFSLQSQSSLTSNKTKESALSKTNLQDSSILSMSSSEDEDEHRISDDKNGGRNRSVESIDDHGEIIIGRAQALDVRSRRRRRPSDSKISTRSTSTGAATIEVMYTPDLQSPPMFSRPFSSRRSSHARQQPSVILEDEDYMPKTRSNPPMSPTSSRTARTSKSEPLTRAEGQKMMAVTAEEEALLEMMRRKRAAMAEHSFTEGYKTAILQESRQKTPPEKRTSAFLSTDSPSSPSPPRAVKISSRQYPSEASSPLLLALPPRGRPKKSDHGSNTGTSILRDSSSCDPHRHESHSRESSFAHQLSLPPEFSPIDLFPSPARTPTEVSAASPTTSANASPLPSPITPGLKHGETDVEVKVAGSEPSCNGDNDEVAILDSGVIDPPLGSIKPGSTSRVSRESISAHHQRRRTASSGADVSFSPIRASFRSNPSEDTPGLPPVSEASFRTRNSHDPRTQSENSKRVGSSTFNTAGVRNSVSMNSLRSASPALSPIDRRRHKGASKESMNSISRDSIVVGNASTRCSVSEDVLAAWGSLGGWRDVGNS